MKLPDLKARDIMTARPVTVREDATLSDIIGILDETRFSALPVLNKAGHALGVITRADLISHYRLQMQGQTRRKAGSVEPDSTGDEDIISIGEVMNTEFFSLPADTPVSEVVRTMLEQKVHRLYVMSELGELVGVISSNDILRSLVD